MRPTRKSFLLRIFSSSHLSTVDSWFSSNLFHFNSTKFFHSICERSIIICRSRPVSCSPIASPPVAISLSLNVPEPRAKR
uniref:ORF79a n=1 Tax=Pinus koraiensis TaxID=88728 RepID=Q85X55_PINKO|nr:ORF79a [Pinus koraiensis]